MCDLHHTCGEDQKREFSSLASNLVAMVLPQNHCDDFLV
jgi:hypothetical protein